MGVKPRGHGFSRSIFKHVNGTPSLEIDDEGAVALAFAPRPIIYPNDFRFGPLRQRHAAHPSQEGIATAWDTVASQVPSAGSAAEDQARVGLRRGQSGVPGFISGKFSVREIATKSLLVARNDYVWKNNVFCYMLLH